MPTHAPRRSRPDMCFEHGSKARAARPLAYIRKIKSGPKPQTPKILRWVDMMSTEYWLALTPKNYKRLIWIHLNFVPTMIVLELIMGSLFSD